MKLPPHVLKHRPMIGAKRRGENSACAGQEANLDHMAANSDEHNKFSEALLLMLLLIPRVLGSRQT